MWEREPWGQAGVYKVWAVGRLRCDDSVFVLSMVVCAGFEMNCSSSFHLHFYNGHHHHHKHHYYHHNHSTACTVFVCVVHTHKQAFLQAYKPKLIYMLIQTRIRMHKVCILNFNWMPTVSPRTHKPHCTGVYQLELVSVYNLVFYEAPIH